MKFSISFTYHPDIKIIYNDSTNKQRIYQPDFIIDNELVEIKGDQFFNEKGQLYNPYKKILELEKQQCMKDNNVKILRGKDIYEYKKVLDTNYPGLLSSILNTNSSQ